MFKECPCRSHKEGLFEREVIPWPVRAGLENLSTLTVLGDITNGRAEVVVVSGRVRRSH